MSLRSLQHGVMKSMNSASPVSFTRTYSAQLGANALANAGVDFGNILNRTGTEPTSYSFWVKTSSTYACEVINRSIVSGYGYRIYIYNSGEVELDYYADDGGPGSSGFAWSTTIINDGVWHHVVIIDDGSMTPSNVLFYIDGVLDTTQATPEGPIVGTLASASRFFVGNSTLTVGGIPGQGNAYIGDGVVGDVAVIPWAVGFSEVTELFNGGIELDMTTFSGWNTLKSNPKSLWLTWEAPDDLSYTFGAFAEGTSVLGEWIGSNVGGLDGNSITVNFRSDNPGNATPFTVTGPIPYIIDIWQYDGSGNARSDTNTQSNLQTTWWNTPAVNDIATYMTAEGGNPPAWGDTVALSGGGVGTVITGHVIDRTANKYTGSPINTISEDRVLDVPPITLVLAEYIDLNYNTPALASDASGLYFFKARLTDGAIDRYVGIESSQGALDVPYPVGTSFVWNGAAGISCVYDTSSTGNYMYLWNDPTSGNYGMPDARFQVVGPHTEYVFTTPNSPLSPAHILLVNGAEL